MRLLSAFLFTLLTAPAFAVDWGAFIGFNTTEFDSNGGSWDRELGFEAGASALVPIDGAFFFRTGAGFVQKSSTLDNRDLEMTLNYLEIPLTAMYKVNETVGLIGGFNLDLKISDDCDSNGGSCNIQDPETFILNLSLGGRFNLKGPHNIEGLLEIGLTDIADEIELANSVAFRYVYMFN